MKKIIIFLCIILICVFMVKNFKKSNIDTSNLENIDNEEIVENTITDAHIDIASTREINYENTFWKVTSWGNKDAGQMLCFTIEGDNGGLIIVDGGYRTSEVDLDVVNSKINEHNGLVDAWIITHFDEDHAGVFDYFVMNKASSITINKVYTPDVTLSFETLKKGAPFTNDWSVYTDYLTFNLSQETKVHTGDEFEEDLIGLKMKVLSSYEDWMKDATTNYLNSGGMAFKLIGNEESILFMADIDSKVVGDKILENYKDELKSDYIQVPHHGNSDITYDFYDAVDPKYAFFCSPDWIFTNPNNVSWYTADKLRTYLESKGVNCVSFATSPNQIILK